MTQVIRTYVPNSMANYNHLVVCQNTQTTAAVDPFDAQHLIELAKSHGLTITQIWITHEHGDHIRDAEKLKELTGANIIAPKTCKGHVHADVWLADEEQFKLGNESITHWLTPGHINGHGIFFSQPKAGQAPFLMAGDTLFNAGVGNVKSGNVEQLHHSVARIISQIDPSTELYCGHDYSETNLKFVLNYFPSCTSAQQALQTASRETPDTRSIKTLAEEVTYNPFLALGSAWLNECTALRNLPELQQFILLRTLRDQW